MAAFVPPAVVTSTLAEPALLDGVVHMIDVADTTLTPVHAAPPTVTPVAPVRFVPVMVMFVPPDVDPDEGETAVTIGGSMIEITETELPP